MLYEEHRAEIDGVVTDIVMPGLGGRGLARQIREHDADLPDRLHLGPPRGDARDPAAQERAPRCCRSRSRSTRSSTRSAGSSVTRPRRRRSSGRASRRACSSTTIRPCSTPCRRFLEARGVRVSQARDGEEAVATIRAVQPDVAIVDVAMSPVSGIDVARQRRRRQPGDEGDPLHGAQRPRAARPCTRGGRTRLRAQGRLARVARGSRAHRRRRRDMGRLGPRNRGGVARDRLRRFPR